MWATITLPDAALNFITQELNDAPLLFEKSFAEILNKSRTVSTYVPDELVVCGTQLLDFRSSILPPQRPADDDADRGVWQTISENLFDAILIALMREYLRVDPRRLIIFNEPVPDLAQSPYDFPLRVARFENALHYFITADDLDSGDRLIEPWDHARFIHWQAIGIFVDGFDHSIAGSDVTLTEDVISDVAHHADALVVGAYDMEGFLAVGELPGRG